MPKSYIFTLRRTPSSNNFLNCTMQVDSFLEVPDQQEVLYDLLTENMSELNAFSSMVKAIKLRNHFNADILPDIFKVDFSGDNLDIETFQNYIDTLTEEQLNEFIRDASTNSKRKT